MDFERIKRNLRFRSGRSKKSPKQTSTVQNGVQKDQARTNGAEKEQPNQNGTAKQQPDQGGVEKKPPSQPPTREYSFIRKKSDPSLRVWDQSTALPQIESDREIPDPAQAATPEKPSSYYYQQATQPAAQPATRPATQPDSEPSYQKAVSKELGSPEPGNNESTSTMQRSQTPKNGMQRLNDAATQPNHFKTKQPQAEARTTDVPPPSQSTDDTDDFDLKPPTRRKKVTSLDILSESLFGGGHLDAILHEPQLFGRFTAFLNRYRPQASPVLVRYLETQKAIKAVEYANAVAESVAPLPSDSNTEKRTTAAQLDPLFEAMRKKAFEELLSQALPAYVTYSIIKVATEIMVNEITGRSTPIMKGLVSGLTEVFCLTDPNQEDNPIIYASEEFYNMTGYAREFVIGTNCRFLQGPKTKRHSVHRLRQAIDDGQEHSEALLNYRRDGRPFLNLLMTAPLYDNKGNVKYFIGAQIDVSGLVEGGKGLDTFDKYLKNEQAQKSGASHGRSSNPNQSQVSLSSKEAKKKALNKLGELSDMFDLEESSVVAQRSRSTSRGRRSEDEESIGSHKERRRFADSSESESEEDGDGEKEKAAWTLSQTGSSGKLPGVYQSYLLMRPSPSMKIIFASPGLRKLGNFVQSPFMAHITAPLKTLKGMKESFETGNPVTAKVHFSEEPSRGGGKAIDRAQSRENLNEAPPARRGRICWISATPLLGDDDSVGVWMVVFVDQRSLSSAMPRSRSNSKSQHTPSQREDNKEQAESIPKIPSSNPTPNSSSRSSRPTHIAMPDRIGSQEDTRQGSVASKTDTRKPSLMPERTVSGRNIMVRKNEPLYRQQQRQEREEREEREEQQHQQQQQNEQQEQSMSVVSTPRSKETSTQDANGFVRKNKPRDLPSKRERVNIKPDTDDEAEGEGNDTFTISSETEQKPGIINYSESAPVEEADTLKEKDTSTRTPATPEKVVESNTLDGVEAEEKETEDVPQADAVTKEVPESEERVPEGERVTSPTSKEIREPQVDEQAGIPQTATTTEEVQKLEANGIDDELEAARTGDAAQGSNVQEAEEAPVAATAKDITQEPAKAIEYPMEDAMAPSQEPAKTIEYPMEDAIAPSQEPAPTAEYARISEPDDDSGIALGESARSPPVGPTLSSQEPAIAHDPRTSEAKDDSGIALGESARSATVGHTISPSRQLQEGSGTPRNDETQTGHDSGIALDEPTRSPPTDNSLSSSHEVREDSGSTDDGDITLKPEDEIMVSSLPESARSQPVEHSMSPSSGLRGGSSRAPEDYTTLKPEDESKAKPTESATSPPAGPTLPPTEEPLKDDEVALESDGEGEYEPVRLPSNPEEGEETNDDTSHHESLHPAAHMDNDPSGHEEEEEGEEELGQEQHHTQHQRPTRPTGYMDYVRHQGSRPASQYGKPGGMTRMGTGTSLAELQNAIGGGSGHDEDPDCARTPFSVD